MPPPSPAPAAPVLAQPEPASTPPVAQQVAAAPSPAPAPVDAGAEGDRSLADIMRELDVPDSEKAQSVVPVNLADIAKIQEQKRQTDQAMADLRKKQAADKAKAEAAKAKAAADAKAKAEAERLKKNPERNWVQVGTGRSISALGFTWGKLQKQYAGMKGKSAFTASWGATNRLVIGPFASFAKAKEVEAELKKDGADCFAWQSRAGEEVSGLK